MSHGFELLQEATIAEIDTHVRRYRHRTGAQLMSLSNDDENKVFGVTFRTPVSDSTGVAHILEHAVLCGSRRYPVKEPFLELLKGSLHTFLNAFTYPDRTCYPVASQNLQDFYHLIDVYLDAVFHPLLTPFVLQQEGWHYNLEHPDQRLAYSGVVYNEMKGDYSDPESRLLTTVQQSLFPDTVYRYDAGGDPEHIPALTFQQFQRYHADHYHPGNALIWFYGDDDPRRRLELLDGFLGEFAPRESTPVVAPQTLNASPHRLQQYYAASDTDKALVTVNWLLPADLDTDTRRMLRILEHVLLGMPGSPLRRTLIESGLGEDLTGAGLETELIQPYLSVGLKGVQLGAEQDVEKLVLETLERIGQEGIDAAQRAAALNTIEFALRENNTGTMPRGLALMLRALTSWVYAGDPFERLGFERSMERLHERLESQPRYLEAMLQRYFLDNRHRTTVTLLPDAALERRRQVDEELRLERVKAAMTAEDLQSVVAATAELRRRQSAPDRPEDLARIPMLQRSDLPRQVLLIPTDVDRIESSPCLFHDLQTNGIAYIDVGLDLRTWRQEWLSYLPLFGRMLLEMDTRNRDYVELGQWIGSKTGGLHARNLISVRRDTGEPVVWLFLRGKVLCDRVGDVLEIMAEVLLCGRCDQRQRFRQIVLEEKAQEEMSLVAEGSRFVATRLGAHFHPSGGILEQIRGVSYVGFLRQLIGRIEHDWDSVQTDLEQLREAVVSRPCMLVNVTLPEAQRGAVEGALGGFLDRFPDAPRVRPEWHLQPLTEDEALLAPTQVNHVGKAASLFPLGFRYSGMAATVARFLAASWLWEQVRVQGGAYGAACSLDPFTGVLQYTSYRDPNLGATLERFDASGRFLRQLDLTDTELTRAIIGAVGDMDQYQLPDARGFTAVARHLSHVTDAYRQQIRDEVLATRKEDFTAMAEVLDRAAVAGHVVVLAGTHAVDEAVAAGLKEPRRTPLF